MKVDKIYQNYESKGRYNQRIPASYNVNFAKKTPTSLNGKIMDSLPDKNTIKFMKKLEWLKGEIGGILITAIGTGLVAPFPIAYNPFVNPPDGATEEEKKDVENTKKYTAMRQPISAVLAILFQVSALKPIDKFLDVIFNNPEYAKHVGVHVDQSTINGKSYIEKLAKEKIKKENPSLKGKEYEALLETTKKEIENSQINKVANEFQQTGKIKIGERVLDNKSLAELVNSQIDEYIKDAKALKIDNNGLAFYSDRAKILMENEAHLAEIFKDAPKDSTKITDFVKNLRNKEKNSDVKMLLDEILARPADIQHNRIQRTLDRIECIKHMCDGKYSYEKYIDAMSTRNAKLDNLITEFMHAKIKDPKLATDEGIKKSIETVTETCRFDKSNSLMHTILHDTDTFHFDKEKLSGKIHKDITQKYKDFVRNHYKGLNQIIKIVIGVGITLPITCNVLNWVYPRIMDKFFPSLSGSKKAQKEREVK